MRVITFNANGIRSAASKGFFAWLAEQNADVVCLQETKAHTHQLPPDTYHPAGYRCHYHDAERKGYSGVALFARRESPSSPAASRTRYEPDWAGRSATRKAAGWKRASAI